MTREEFIENFVKVEANCFVGDKNALDPMGTLTLSLIGSIYDLQVQSAQQHKVIHFLNKRVVDLEQKVYKTDACCKGGEQWGHSWGCPTLN